MLNYMIVVNDGDELKTVSMLDMIENDQQFAELLDEKLNAILDARMGVYPATEIQQNGE